MDFIRQTERPIFEDLVWMKPEKVTDDQQIIIMGGHAQALQAPMQLFNACEQQKLEISILLPDVVKKTLSTGTAQSGLLFAPSTPAGSFSLTGFEEIMTTIEAYNFLLLAGDLSSNQETKQLLSKITTEFKDFKIATENILKSLSLADLMKAQNLILILNSNQLKPLIEQRTKLSYSPNLPTDAFVKILKALKTELNLIIFHNQHLFIKIEQQICASQMSLKFDFNQDKQFHLASLIAYYLTYNPSNMFANLVTASWQKNFI